MIRSYADAVRALTSKPHAGAYIGLPFFRDGPAARIAAALDAEVASGADVWPRPDHVFNALRMTPADRVRVVILGQDPYPTPGDAHGLSFSIGRGGPLPRSLANIFRELQADVGGPLRARGDLSDWAAEGVLLLNAGLTVRAGEAGSHRKLGWALLTDEVISLLGGGQRPTVFVLWGQDAQAKRPLIDERRHLVLASAHPSPLSARRGFFGSRPFSRANAWLETQGRGSIAWT